jgi:hypothetical protein
MVAVDISHAFAPITGGIARAFAWGPGSGDWEHLGHWLIRWSSPFEGRAEVRSSASSRAPFADEDAARRALTGGRGVPVVWTAVVSEDSSAALLLGRRGRETDLIAVDDGGPPVAIRRVDAEPWGTIQSALHASGEWFIVTSEDSRPNTASIFRTDASGARRLAEVSRAVLSSPSLRLARHSDGVTIGLIVDGEPPADRSASRRWVVPVNMESAVVGAPEPLGAADLSDRAVAVCGEGEGLPWVLEQPLTANVELTTGARSVALGQIYARLRASAERACLERLVGDGSTSDQSPPPAELRRAVDTPTLPVTIIWHDRRVALRCEEASTK